MSGKFGTVRKLPSGRYQANYWHDGARHYAPHTFPTGVKARDWLTQQHAELLKGTWIDPNAGRITLREYATTWLVGREDLEVLTRELYNQLLNDHILPTFGDRTLRELSQSPNLIRTWRANLPAAIVKNEQRVAAKAKRKTRANVTGKTAAAKSYRLLSQIMKTAVSDDLIAKSPCRVKGGGKEHAPERETVPLADAQIALDAMPERMQAALLVAIWCQFRRGEFLGARRRDLDMTKGTLRARTTRVKKMDGTIVEKEPKSDAGKRTLAVPKHILPALVEHLDRFVADDPDAYLFTGVHGRPLHPGTFYKNWDEARALIKRPGLRPHDLRHTGLTLFASMGATTAELMYRGGHSSSEAALRYQHATADRDRFLADAMSTFAQARSKATGMPVLIVHESDTPDDIATAVGK